jgi:uncharacterized protein (DUF427 family)
MLTPGPDHPIDLCRNPRRVRVLAAGHVIADSTDVITLREADLPPVEYFPRNDVETGFLSEAPTTSEDPYKGRATHYTSLIDGELIENVAWSYEQAYPAVEGIRGRLAFDAKLVEVYEVDEDDLNRREHPHAGGQPPFANA